MSTLRSDHTLVLTSYPPRVCGIATYAQDLLTALKRMYGNAFAFRICALEKGPRSYEYPSEVKCILNTLDEASYSALARRINTDPRISRVWVQHEFGLFPGGDGRFLLNLLRSIQKPVSITFHTVLREPSPERRQMVQALAQRAHAVIVLTERSRDLLQDLYAVPMEKLHVIPHGTHVILSEGRETMKRKLGLDGRMVLANFGLLSENKGIETAIEAMPAIVRSEPRALYLVMGRTHPDIVKQQGERYRRSLEARVRELGLQDHVRFVDRYMELHELLDYLCATDVYLFTSKDPQQAVSGTFVYAMGCGCAVISTRIPHAEEMLGDAGILIDFNSSGQLADAAIKLLQDDTLRTQMGRNALSRMSATSWDNIAIAHASALNGGRVPAVKRPPIKLDHLRRMTTSHGMLQFCDLNQPDPGSGYTVDDNARALIAVAMLAEVTGRVENELIATFLDLIGECQQPDGSFLNYMDVHGRFTAQNSEVNLDDPNGRAIWALGTVASTRSIPREFRDQAVVLLRNALPHVLQIRSPRAIAFIMKGLYAYNTDRADERIRKEIDRLGSRLLVGVAAHFSTDWNWIEPEMTYGNAVIPEALLIGFLATGDKLYERTARATLDFLVEHTFLNGKFRGISNFGWMKKGRKRHPFGEQPIEAAYTILALEQFWNAYGTPQYLRDMRKAFHWFLGENHLHQCIYDRTTGGCRDGLEEHNVSLNQGAESTVCYLIARLALQRSLDKVRVKPEERPVGSRSMLPLAHYGHSDRERTSTLRGLA